MWEQRSQVQLAEVRTIAEAVVQADEPVDTVVARLAHALPVDEHWLPVNSGFTAHALRLPELRRVIAARAEAIIAAMVPPLIGALVHLGRAVPDAEALGRALVAVHDGTAAQVRARARQPRGVAAAHQPLRPRRHRLQHKGQFEMDTEPEVIVVGAGVAGLVATHELVKAGRRVLVLG